jgi:hypothetical protein
MISGAANDSEPQRVLSIGEEAEINRERPKSVSLSSGVGRRSSGIDPLSVGGNEKGLTVRMISKHQLDSVILTHSLA